jgi:hypothetical protein
MDRWFIVSDKPFYNNREVRLYFGRKLWIQFILGHHVYYFDIGEFQEVGCGLAHDQKNVKCDPLLGPHPLRWIPNPPTQHLPISEIIS